MAIPASVTLYVRWTNGQPLSGGTYTAATPDKPNGHTYTFSNSAALVVDNDSPWSGQYMADFTAAWNATVTSTVSSSTVQATSGRIYFEGEGQTDDAGNYLFRLEPTTANNGKIQCWRVNGTPDKLRCAITVDGGNYDASVDHDFPSNPYAVEIIYDTNNATSTLRFRARVWELSGSPGSFVNGTLNWQGTTDQYTTLILADYDAGTTAYKVNRIAISNDTSEDLSNLSESAAASVYAFQ